MLLVFYSKRKTVQLAWVFVQLTTFSVQFPDFTVQLQVIFVRLSLNIKRIIFPASKKGGTRL